MDLKLRIFHVKSNAKRLLISIIQNIQYNMISLEVREKAASFYSLLLFGLFQAAPSMTWVNYLSSRNKNV